MTVFEMIDAQQKGKENTAPWMVGEQLKDICRADPGCAEGRPAGKPRRGCVQNAVQTGAGGF